VPGTLNGSQYTHVKSVVAGLRKKTTSEFDTQKNYIKILNKKEAERNKRSGIAHADDN